ncbi:MAG: hypothetical protein HWE22_20090 [Flavobacteriales bacterium]|nr:hypothetical protein [Flavobacteriales bacterium]
MFILTACSLNAPHKASTSQDQTPPWIETIVSYSQPRVQESSIDLYDGEFFVEEIDSSFFKEHLAGFETNYPSKQKIEFDSYSRYFFLDCQKYESWVSFTIMQIPKRKNHLITVYSYTYDLKSEKITSVSCVAKTENNGDTWKREHLLYSDSGKKLTVSTLSYRDQLIDYEGGLDYCYTQSFDSIVSNYHFFPNRTSYSMDTLASKLDTICL